MHSSNPRLAGLWIATYPGLKQTPADCYCCGQRVPLGKTSYRLLEQVSRYGERPKVVGRLCRPCRRALGPQRKGNYFTEIQAVDERQTA